MLADAVAAERFRLIRDRTGLFWGFLFAPLVSLVLGLGGQLLTALFRAPRIPAAMKADIAGRMVAAISGWPLLFAMLFMLVGAAAIFAGDYRWETWRLIVPRNSRLNLLLGKFVVYAEWTAISLVLLALVGVVLQVTGVIILGGGLSGPRSGGVFLGQFAGVFAISWLEVLLAGALAALIGVLTRSTLGAVLAGQGLLVLQSLVGTMAQAPSWKTLALPAYSARLLKVFVQSPSGMRPENGPVALGLALMVFWLVALAAGAIALFLRQDLTRE